MELPTGRQGTPRMEFSRILTLAVRLPSETAACKEALPCSSESFQVVHQARHKQNCFLRSWSPTGPPRVTPCVPAASSTSPPGPLPDLMSASFVPYLENPVPHLPAPPTPFPSDMKVTWLNVTLFIFLLF